MRGRTDSVATAGRLRAATAAAALAWLSLLPLLAPTSGCGRGRVNPQICSDDPSEKIPGIVAAVERKDLKKAGHMVEDLSSDDPAVRMFAIGGLRRLTGETFGYNYYDDEDAREPAVKRWREWLAAQELAN